MRDMVALGLGDHRKVRPGVGAQVLTTRGGHPGGGHGTMDDMAADAMRIGHGMTKALRGVAWDHGDPTQIGPGRRLMRENLNESIMVEGQGTMSDEEIGEATARNEIRVLRFLPWPGLTGMEIRRREKSRRWEMAENLANQGLIEKEMERS